MELTPLKTFLVVADLGHVTRAARALHLTQPAVSAQLAKLEEEVGEQLLERRGRGIGLTDAANLLASHAARALSVLTEAEAELDARRAAVAGELTLAAFATAARGLAPQALRLLSVAHPALRVSLHEIEPHESVPLLARGGIDLVIAQDWVNAPLALPEGLTKASLLDDMADIALPVRHRLANRSTVALADLAGEPWITWPRGSICHDWLMLMLRTFGREPLVRHTAAEYATQVALVAVGLGAAVLPRLGRGPVPKGVRIVQVTPTLHRHVYAIWRADATRRTAIKAAVDALTASVRLFEAGSKNPAPALAPRRVRRSPNASSARARSVGGRR